MSVFEHQRSRIVSKHQHPWVHPASEFSYNNQAVGTAVENVEQALDWVFAVLYPHSSGYVETKAALDAIVAPSANEFRVVLADESQGGVMTAYRYEQLEGEVASSWHLVYRLDWGESSVISGVLNKTMDVCVYKYGYDDKDADGVDLTGVNAGQHIYGGASANTNLCLHANSGDGTGAQTGYIHHFDDVRPYADSAISLGTTDERYLKIWTDEITINTMTITTGSIIDSSGAISFGDENLSTTGSIAAGTLTISDGSIVDSSGAISFGNENLTTTGTFQSGNLKLTTNTLSSEDVDGNIVITPNGSGVVQVSNAMETVGQTVTGTVDITGQLDVDNVRVNGNAVSITDTDGNLTLSANGAGVVDVPSAMTTIGQTITGTLDVTGQLDVDELRLDGRTLSSTDTDGNIIIDPNGTGLIELGSACYPETTSAWDIGKTGNVWNDLWIDGNIQDGSNSISIANLMTFRAVGSPSVGDSLFWDGSKWVSSNPDDEIDHGEINATSLTHDDHTQYALLAGRSGSQTLSGGSASSESLFLKSNASDPTTGTIWVYSDVKPFTDDQSDLGAAAKRFNDLYLSGEAKGLRLENYSTVSRPAASATTPGRVVFDTDLNDVFVDNGGYWLQMTADRWELEDATTWTGSVKTATYTVDGSVTPARGRVSDARKAIWSFKDNSNNYLQMDAEITATSATSVTVTFDVNLPAGTYTLIGVQ